MCNLDTRPQDASPAPLPGVISDNIIGPEQLKDLYYEQIIKGFVYQPTPLSEAFLQTENIEYLRTTIEANLQRYLEDPQIRFLLTREFAQTVIDHLKNNQSLAYDVQYGLPILNDLIVHSETEVALLSQRQERRYTRWALHNDRMKIMPYGIGEKTLHVRGENQVSPSGYLMNHPFQSQHNHYLRDVLHVQCPSNSTAPCKVPPFPLRFPTP